MRSTGAFEDDDVLLGSKDSFRDPVWQLASSSSFQQSPRDGPLVTIKCIFRYWIYIHLGTNYTLLDSRVKGLLEIHGADFSLCQ